MRNLTHSSNTSDASRTDHALSTDRQAIVLLVGVRGFDSDRLRAILTLKGAFGVQNAIAFCEPYSQCAEAFGWHGVSIGWAPASRRHSDVYKLLLLIGTLETPADIGS